MEETAANNSLSKEILCFSGREPLQEERERGPGTSDQLLEDSTNLGVGGINSKGHRGVWLRMSQHRNIGKEKLGAAKGSRTSRRC